MNSDFQHSTIHTLFPPAGPGQAARTVPAERPDGRSALARFLDNFLQERNIQWVLVAGVIILLGSTLMLVVTHWQSYTPIWKYLIMLGYTGVIYGAGVWSYGVLGLRKTGTVLMALTVLLLPVMFLALHWVQLPAASNSIGAGAAESPTLSSPTLAWRGTNLMLLLGTMAFTCHAASHIFKQFLRKSQPTFLASYLILCVAGTIAPLLPAMLAPWGALLLWGVFGVGTIKINRHLFWLIEDHSAPRIFGFFPIALLGAQFLGVFAIHFAGHVPLEWMGFGSVLVAVPILLTADAVARVFQQRTGNIVRPLPLSIVAPLLSGLVLCVVGICLSASGLMALRSPFALTPTAALVAAMMFVVARRTGKQAFVWAMLAALVLAYNFSPVYFQDLAVQAVRTGAHAVREAQLPYAFYGLTYLPLLALFGAWSAVAARRNDQVFAAPIRRFSVALAGVLLAVSLGHVKAMLPVASVMVLVFGAYTVCFRRPWLSIPAVTAFLIASYGLTPFCSQVLALSLDPTTTLACMSVASVILLGAGRSIDRRIQMLAAAPELPGGMEWAKAAVCETASACAAVFVALDWLGTYVDVRAMAGHVPVNAAGIIAACVVTGLFVAHALRWRQPVLGASAMVFGYTAAVTIALRAGVGFGTVSSLATLMLLVQWLIDYRFQIANGGRLADVFGAVNRAFCTAGLLLALVAHLPFAIADMLCIPQILPGLAAIEPWWVCRILAAVWSFDLARRTENRGFAALGCLATLALPGAAWMHSFGDAGWRWLPAVWATTACAGVPIVAYWKRCVADSGSARAVAEPIEGATLFVSGLIGTVTLFVFTGPMAVAGALSLAGLFGLASVGQRPLARSLGLALLNWHLVALAIVIIGPIELVTVLDLATWKALAVYVPVALFSAASLLVCQWTSTKYMHATVASVHRASLRVVAFASLFGTLWLSAPTAAELLFATVSFSLLTAAELYAACRNGSESRVWSAEVIVAAAVGFLAWHGVIHFGHGLSMFALLGAGVAAWLFSRWTAPIGAVAIMSRPLERTGMTLPAVTVALGVLRHAFVAHPMWLGMNSLALLLAAGFYFWHGVERRARGSFVAAAVILDIALALLWRDLQWTDPQFYLIPIGLTILALVRLLNSEIPRSLHAPLNYLGALVILVSPTFHIVAGSWLHLFTLMLLSVLVVLGAIGFRVRALMYTGTAFLVADLAAMVVRGSVDDPNLLWIAGVALGAGVVALGAIAERNREALLQRLRVVSATLQAWE
jgi:hypothetical protein